MIFDMSFAAIGIKMAHVNTKWDLSWPEITPRWLGLARSWTKLVPNTTKLGPSWLGMRILNDFRGSKPALGPSQGVRGGTRDAPRIHQGCTKRHQGCTKEATAHRDGPQGTQHTSRDLRTSNGRSGIRVVYIVEHHTGLI